MGRARAVQRRAGLHQPRPAPRLPWRAPRHVLLAQWSAARPERSVPVQRAHGAAPHARVRHRTAARHGHARRDAPAGAPPARSCAARPMADRAGSRVRDLQCRDGGMAPAAVLNYALAHHPMHIVQHLMFLAASVIMWWPILSPLPELPRLSYPGQMLYLFLLSIPMAIVA